MNDFQTPEIDLAELSELLYRKTFLEWSTNVSLATAEEGEASTVRVQAAAAAEWFKTNVLHDVWALAYQSGVEDERMSEANIGVAGCLCNSYPCQCKIGPARTNPYPKESKS